MIPDEAVEAAAEALTCVDRKSWALITRETRESILGDARRALEAAAPHMMASAWDEGEDAGMHNAGAEQWGYPYKDNPYRKPTDAV